MADPIPEIDSVLTSVKRSLDIAPDDTSFDTVLLMHINTVFSDLYQLGLGVYGSDEIRIEDAEATWDSVFGAQKNLGMIQSYIYLRVRLLHDPPQSGFTTNNFQAQIDKMEWRIKTAASSSPNAPEV